MLMPSQYALKLPATKPERMFSDAPPSRDDVTTSLTWPDSVDVNTFTSSGMIAPATVPHVMMVESFHHNEPSPQPRNQNIRHGIRNDDRDDRRQPITSDVSGASKFILSTLPYRALATASLMK